MFVFFFSSRRRHTRFDCDWSSDVCSSDLHTNVVSGIPGRLRWKARFKKSGSRLTAGNTRLGEGRGGEEGRSRGAAGPLKKKIRYQLFTGQRQISASLNDIHMQSFSRCA